MNVCAVDGSVSSLCATCGIPWDASYFDESRIVELGSLNIGEEITLVNFQLHRNYCGILMNFAQFTDAYADNNKNVLTKGFHWSIRVNGVPLDPYLTLDHILNPWGQTDNPVHLRLEVNSYVEMVLRRTGPPGDPPIMIVGGRITGRYWYNTDFGGRPNGL
jgi:hypothetical protein